MNDDFTTLRLRINGESRAVVFPTHHTLLEVLREECGLTGTKHGCELGECGTCAVLVDGRPVLSCLVLAAEMEGREIETVEGLQIGNELHPLQAAFADLGAAQCGCCTPGILMTAKALPEDNPRPGDPEIREALSPLATHSSTTLSISWDHETDTRLRGGGLGSHTGPGMLGVALLQGA